MSTDLPAWLGDFGPEQLLHHHDGGVVERAQSYASQGRVSRLKSMGPNGLQAEVKGTRPVPYTVVVTRNPANRDTLASLRLHCSCPVGIDCKHALAVLLVANQHVVFSRIRRGNWQRDLAYLINLEDDPDRPDHGSPLALETTVVGSDVELRPLRQGSREKWVRGQISWDNLRGHGVQAHRRDHVHALEAIARHAEQAHLLRGQGFGYGHYDRSSIRLNALGHEVWGLLAKAREVGVEFVERSEGHALTLGGSPLELVLKGSLTDDEGLALISEVTGQPDGWQLVGPLGNPAHGLLLRDGSDSLALGFSHPLSREQHQILVMRHPLHVPNDELATFALSYLPRLREHVEVRLADDVQLPETPKPQLLLHATTITQTIGQPVAVRLAVGYRYGQQHSADVTLDAGHSLPIRDVDAEKALRPLAQDVLEHLQLPLDQLPHAHLLEGAEALRLLGRVQSLPAHDDVVVVTDGELGEVTELENPQVALDIDQQGGRDWFDLTIEMTVGGVNVPLAQLLVALAHERDHLMLEDGRWVSLDHPEMTRLRQLLAEAELIPEVVQAEDGTLRVRLRPEQFSWFDELREFGVLRRESDAWADVVARIAALDEQSEVAAPVQLQAELRPYQLVGLRWLDSLHSIGVGGVLADDMGLGKTLQAIALVCSLAERDELTGPVLVVAPSSVVGGWVEQFARFAPQVRVTAVTETSRKRTTTLDELVANSEVIVTSYAIARLDVDQFSSHSWQLAFVDEAQFVKNPASNTYQALRRIPCRVRFALSGTPLENNLMDLWSLLSLSAPGLFADPKKFRQRYARPIENHDPESAELLARLQRRTRPVMLRRTKELVAPELPPRQEQVLSVPLAPAHRRLYDRQLTLERKKVLGLVTDLNKNRIEILSSLTRLRQLSLAAQLLDDEPGGPPSAKIDTLVEMMADVVAGGHRALVFSSFTGFLGMVRDRLAAEGIDAVYLDGRTRNRQQRIDEFRSGDAPAFLISLKAGGFGLNLTEADYVFVLDPWWNPAAEAQAIDRAHRIGQTKRVMVYRLISEDTIEAKVLALQDSKRELFSAVVDGGEGAVAGALTADDIRSLFE